VGIFGDFKNTMQAAGNAANAASGLAAAQTATLNGAAAPDPGNPVWLPIAGVTLDQYARISALLAKSGVMGIEAVTQFVESQGVPAGAWQEVQTGWVQRMSTNPSVAQRYGLLYSQV
jgi:hypothetical protein